MMYSWSEMSAKQIAHLKVWELGSAGGGVFSECCWFSIGSSTSVFIVVGCMQHARTCLSCSHHTPSVKPRPLRTRHVVTCEAFSVLLSEAHRAAAALVSARNTSSFVACYDKHRDKYIGSLATAALRMNLAANVSTPETTHLP